MSNIKFDGKLFCFDLNLKDLNGDYCDETIVSLGGGIHRRMA